MIRQMQAARRDDCRYVRRTVDQIVLGSRFDFFFGITNYQVPFRLSCFNLLFVPRRFGAEKSLVSRR